jgi:nucleolar protein 58
MRVREWYGLHFPELGKIVTDNMLYVRLVKKVGYSQNMATANLEEVLPEDLIEEVREAAIVTMGSSISDSDLNHIQHLCEEVESLTNYRETLFNYIKNRMNAIAPNLSVLVGELVGARLIAHAGSLMNLAKHPASTVQILGAEKALFRALKTKHDTPKYGLIYHASMVGQASNKHKGKISRMLANKASLSCRVDALGDESGPSIAIEDRAKLEARLRSIEEGQMHRLSGTAKSDKKFKKYDSSKRFATLLSRNISFSSTFF